MYSRSGGKRDDNLPYPESYVTIGTMQPVDLDNVLARDKNKYLPVWKQEVRDEKGRKRLHGAFTGGFSAGYFNTVGSKEGWEPSQFRSSRDSRLKGPAMRPEDFMDDEDIEEFSGGRRVFAKEEYDVFANEKIEQQVSAQLSKDSSVLGSMSSSLLKFSIAPAKDTIGVKLMRLMGWREGQGIGPKKTSSEHSSRFMFAPKETKKSMFVAKNDMHGLGYDPTQYAPELEKKKVNKPQGFGAGVFQDEEDEDIYGIDTAEYDRELFDEPAQKRQQSGFTKGPELNVPQQYQRDKMVSAKQALTGFIVAVSVVTAQDFFPPPKIPKDWKPSRPFPDELKVEKKKLSVSQRAEILGEEQLKKSVPTVTLEQASAALKGFIPFGNDPGKQQRYIDFLESKANQSNYSIENQQELMEFSKAAQIFRPLSQMMASRFVSESQTDWKVCQDDAVHAAKMQMYGVLTRQSQDWIPAKLLCKRMNIADPYPLKPDPGSVSGDKQVLNEESMKMIMMGQDLATTAPLATTSTNAEATEATIEEEEEEPYSRPAMDLFKSIFADSESETETTKPEPLQEMKIATDDSSELLPPPIFRPLFKRKTVTPTTLEPEPIKKKKKSKISSRLSAADFM